MKISCHPYRLTPKHSPNRLSGNDVRVGSLLRIYFPDLKVYGHADLFSWPELGDSTLEQLLDSLCNQPLPQAQAAIQWARHEALARAAGESFFPTDPFVSHVTMTSLAPTTDSLVKLKISTPNAAELVSVISNSPKTIFRLDFNGLFDDIESAHDYWKQIPAELKARIEFVEDPLVEGLIPQARAIFRGTKVAIDRCTLLSNLLHADIRVLKPVYYSPEDLPLFNGEMVVTSNMDHPLGQLQALRAMTLLKNRQQKLLAAGLLTQDLYHPHEHHAWVSQGAGWGLNQQLDSLAWKSL